MKLNCFIVTVSTKDDVSAAVSEALVRYIQKKCYYAYAVAERDSKGVRHLHAAITMKVSTEKNDLVGYFWKLVQPHHPDSIRKYAIDVHAQHDHRWYDEYLKKQVDVEVLYDKYDAVEVAKFFPTDGQQEELMQAVVTGRSAGSVGDKYIDDLVKQWTEYDPTGSDYEDAGKFINYRMYVARDMTCIRDVRRLSQLCWTMFCYRTHRIENSTEFIRLGNQMTGNCI